MNGSVESGNGNNETELNGRNSDAVGALGERVWVGWMINVGLVAEYKIMAKSDYIHHNRSVLVLAL